MSGSLKQFAKFGRDTGIAIGKALKKKAKSSLKASKELASTTFDKAASKLGLTNDEQQQIQRDIDTMPTTDDPEKVTEVEVVSPSDIQLEHLQEEKLVPSGDGTEASDFKQMMEQMMEQVWVLI